MGKLCYSVRLFDLDAYLRTITEAQIQRLHERSSHTPDPSRPRLENQVSSGSGSSGSSAVSRVSYERNTVGIDR